MRSISNLIVFSGYLSRPQSRIILACFRGQAVSPSFIPDGRSFILVVFRYLSMFHEKCRATPTPVHATYLVSGSVLPSGLDELGDSQQSPYSETVPTFRVVLTPEGFLEGLIKCAMRRCWAHSPHLQTAKLNLKAFHARMYTVCRPPNQLYVHMRIAPCFAAIFHNRIRRFSSQRPKLCVTWI